MSGIDELHKQHVEKKKLELIEEGDHREIIERSMTPKILKKVYICFFLGLSYVGFAILATRGVVPRAFSLIIGDIAWAAWLYYGAMMIHQKSKNTVKAIVLLTALIEISQLVQMSGLNALRETLVGKILLGSVFDIKDLLLYAIGIAAAYAYDTRKLQKTNWKFWFEQNYLYVYQCVTVVAAVTLMGYLFGPATLIAFAPIVTMGGLIIFIVKVLEIF